MSTWSTETGCTDGPDDNTTDAPIARRPFRSATEKRRTRRAQHRLRVQVAESGIEQTIPGDSHA